MKENLNGYKKQFKGNYNDEPTEKQKNIILKLQLFYGRDKVPTCKTRKQAWDCINQYADVIKFDKNKNEFYIEDVTITHSTFYTIVSDEELKCRQLVKQLKYTLKGEELEDYENLISYIGDIKTIIEVTELMMEQKRKALIEKMKKRHAESKSRRRHILPMDDSGYEPGVDPDVDADRLLE